jgi:hypothetical protein
MNRAASLRLCATMLILSALSGCGFVPVAGDRVKVDATDATIIILVDADLLSEPDSLSFFASVLKSPRIAPERVSSKNDPIHDEGQTNENAMALRGFAKGSCPIASDEPAPEVLP